MLEPCVLWGNLVVWGNLMDWLDPVLASGPGQRTLVLCRTATSVQLVRRAAAAHGGVFGLEALTPLGLALAVCKPDAFPTGRETEFEPDDGEPPIPAMTDWSLPEGHAWASVADRPGLRDRLARHVHLARLEQLDPHALPEELAGLLDAGWGGAAAVDPLLELLQRARAGRLGDFGHHRVFALGFGDSDAGLPVPHGTRRYHGRLLEALGATVLAAPPRAPGGPLPVVECADPVGEARWVARELAAYVAAGGDPEHALVLVPSESDARRIRAALARSGLPCADDHAQPLRDHALAALLRRLLAWCDPVEDPSLHGEDLRRLFTTPVLQHAWPDENVRSAAAARVAVIETDSPWGRTLEGMLADSAQPTLSRHLVASVLSACHMVRAPLSIWLQALDLVADSDQHYANVRATAAVLRARLAWMATRRGPTLGDLGALAGRFGVAQRDTAARGILAALRDGASLPASVDALDEVLGGVAPRGRIDAGCRLLPYARYDGRPTRLLLLTGLHSKGLGSSPAPDPFLGAEALELLGVPTGERFVAWMLAQARAAVLRAEVARGAVCTHDADGRAVVRVQGLELVFTGEHVVNYGITVESPERANFRALTREVRPIPTPRPDQTPDVASLHAARMASCEWLRAGSYAAGAAHGDGEPVPNLLGEIDAIWPRVPEELRPWLGQAVWNAEAAALRGGAHSVSRTLEPLTHCLYQAFCKAHLRLEAEQELVEDLDARDVGNAVHAVLEATGADPRWRVANAEVQPAVDALITRLGQETRGQAHGQGANGLTEGVRAAERGMLERWCRHWNHYVPERVVDLDQREARACAFARERLGALAHEGMGALYALADPLESLKAPSAASVRRWITLAVEARWRGEDPFDDALLDSDHADVTSLAAPGVRALAGADDTLALLDALVPEFVRLHRYGFALFGPVLAQQAEWGFDGILLDLDGEPLEVRGRIDQMSLTGSSDAPVLQILDYKTGSPSMVKLLGDRMQKGLMPQLFVYALAIARAVSEGRFPLADSLENVPPPWLAYDYVKDPEGGAFGVIAGLETLTPEAVGQLLGGALRLARAAEYPLVPHPEACPIVAGRGFCDFSDVCRFRRYPGAEPAEEGAP